jgi:hypothetical protein
MAGRRTENHRNHQPERRGGEDEAINLLFEKHRLNRIA